MIANTWEVFHFSPTHENDAVLLEVVTFSTDVGDDFFPVREADPSHFSQSRVRLFRGLSLYLKAYTSSLRALVQGGGFFTSYFRFTACLNELVNCRHLWPTPFSLRE
jgi:hypothetical protein